MQTAIVTGAGGNLGKAVVQKFLDEGCRVIGIDMHEPGFAHPNLKMVSLDLTAEEDVEKFVQQTIAEYGSVDVAVLTAGGFAMGKVADTKWKDIMQQFTLNFQTAYNLARP